MSEVDCRGRSVAWGQELTSGRQGDATLGTAGYDVLIVGGSAAGNNAAQSARRQYPDKTVAVVRREPESIVPWHLHRVLQPGYDVRRQVLPDVGYEKRGIDLIPGEAVSLDRDGHTVTLQDGRGIGYERLVLATGSEPVMPPFPGCDRANVRPVLKSLAYLEDLARTVEQAGNVIILGGGFTGMEFADECVKRPGVPVTVVEALACCLYHAFDEHLCRTAERTLTGCGARILTATRVQAGLVEGDRLTGVVLSTGEQLPADVVLIGAGARPLVSLAREAGLPLDPLGAILVDETMRTEDQRIFAAGDCAAKTVFLTGKPSALRTAGIAAAEGRMAGANLFEVASTQSGTVQAYCTVLCGVPFITVGLTQRYAREEGIAVVAGEASRPEEDSGVQARVIFARETHTLLGVQVVGLGDQRAADTLAQWVRAPVTPQRLLTADDLPGTPVPELVLLLQEATQEAVKAL